jgi:hypothetical protein
MQVDIEATGKDEHAWQVLAEVNAYWVFLLQMQAPSQRLKV